MISNPITIMIAVIYNTENTMHVMKEIAKKYPKSPWGFVNPSIKSWILWSSLKKGYELFPENCWIIILLLYFVFMFRISFVNLFTGHASRIKATIKKTLLAHVFALHSALEFFYFFDDFIDVFIHNNTMLQTKSALIMHRLL